MLVDPYKMRPVGRDKEYRHFTSSRPFLVVPTGNHENRIMWLCLKRINMRRVEITDTHEVVDVFDPLLINVKGRVLFDRNPKHFLPTISRLSLGNKFGEYADVSRWVRPGF